MVQIWKGLGFPNKYFCNAKMADVYTSALLADAMKPLNMLTKFENHFANQTVRFQVQLEVGGYFSAQKFSSLQPQQAGRAGTTLQFLNSILQIRLQKYLLDFAQTRCSAKKLRWPCILADAEWANFLGEKFVLWKSALIHSILHQTGTITSGFEGKKRN